MKLSLARTAEENDVIITCKKCGCRATYGVATKIGWTADETTPWSYLCPKHSQEEKQ